MSAKDFFLLPLEARPKDPRNLLTKPNCASFRTLLSLNQEEQLFKGVFDIKNVTKAKTSSVCKHETSKTQVILHESECDQN